MKKILVIPFLIIFYLHAYSTEKSRIYCKDFSGTIHDALSEGGNHICANQLMEGYSCYTGERTQIISLINNDFFNWNEQWLDNAHLSGSDEISYFFIDGPNEYQQKLIMYRCPFESKI